MVECEKHIIGDIACFFWSLLFTYFIKM